MKNFDWVLLIVLFGQSQASIILKSVGIKAVMERKDSNCVGIYLIRGKLQLHQTSGNILYLSKNLLNRFKIYKDSSVISFEIADFCS